MRSCRTSPGHCERDIADGCLHSAYDAQSGIHQKLCSHISLTVKSERCLRRKIDAASSFSCDLSLCVPVSSPVNRGRWQQSAHFHQFPKQPRGRRMRSLASTTWRLTGSRGSWVWSIQDGSTTLTGKAGLSACGPNIYRVRFILNWAIVPVESISAAGGQKSAASKSALKRKPPQSSERGGR
jgi:hypothetical protein